jgi:MYXO-CTERM domain-containing protein
MLLKKLLYSFSVLTLTVMLFGLDVNAQSNQEDNHSITEMAQNNNVTDNVAGTDDDNDMEWGWLGLLGLLGLAGLRRRDDRK